MATQVQFRGGTTTEHASFNGVAKEVTVDTTKQTLVVQDGSTNGGFPLLREKNPDGQKVYFGDGDDFQIWHQAADNRTYLWEKGSGAFSIQGSYVKIQSPQTDPTDASEAEVDLAVFKSDGACELYYAGAATAKLATTSGGIDVDGSVTADDIITAGALLHEGDTDTLIHFSAADTIDLKTGTVARLTINNSGVNLGANLYSAGKNISLGDSASASDDRLQLGNDQDYNIYHTGTNGFQINTTGNTLYQANEHTFYNADSTILNAAFRATDCELRYANSPKFYTTSAGAKVSGRIQIQNGATDVPTMLIGANSGGSGMSQNSNKHANICSPQYISDTQTAGFRLLSAYGNNGANYVYIGGNDDNVASTASAPKSATEVRIYTAATATGNGVERFKITNDGNATFTGNIVNQNGRVLIGTTTVAPYTTRRLTIGDTSMDDTAVEIRSSSGTTGRLYFTDSSTSGEGAYQGAIMFDHGAESANVNKFNFYIGSSKQFSLDSSAATFAGDLKLAATKGISFSNYGDEEDPDNAATDVTGNKLDDYEIGGFTPAFDSNDQGGTFPVATYVKVGRMVHICLSATVGGGSDASTFKVTGLPFAPDKNGTAAVATNCNISCHCRLYDSQSYLEVRRFDASAVTYGNLSDKFIIINATYRCNP